jgi:hypothetical protein
MINGVIHIAVAALPALDLNELMFPIENLRRQKNVPQLCIPPCMLAMGNIPISLGN